MFSVDLTLLNIVKRFYGNNSQCYISNIKHLPSLHSEKLNIIFCFVKPKPVPTLFIWWTKNSHSQQRTLTAVCYMSVAFGKCSLSKITCIKASWKWQKWSIKFEKLRMWEILMGISVDFYLFHLSFWLSFLVIISHEEWERYLGGELTLVPRRFFKISLWVWMCVHMCSLVELGKRLVSWNSELFYSTILKCNYGIVSESGLESIIL